MLDVIVTYVPVYRFHGVVKLVTAGVSLATAIALVPTLPRALALRNPVELKQEIKERRRVEEALRNQTRMMQSILSSLGEGVIVMDAEGKFLLVNPTAEKLLGKGLSDSCPEGWSDTYSLRHPESGTILPVRDLPLARAIRGEPTDEVELLVHNDQHATEVIVSVTGRPLRSEEGVITGGVIVFRDITARKQADAALRERGERFRNAFDHAPNGMFLVGLDGRWLKVNHSLCRIVGRSREEMLATTFQALTHPDDLASDLVQTSRLLAGDIPCLHMEKRYYHKAGHEVWVLLSAGLVRADSGNPLYFVGHVQDISDRKKAEALLRASLAEKEVLLKEIHHRVKNNLQIISSLLQLQAQHARDATTVELFRESQNQVRSMALVHERLYRAHDLARVDFADYLKGLANHLFRSYRADGDLIRLSVHVQETHLPIDTAVPCGLIVNELLSNCLKYAFPEGRAGEIVIEIISRELDMILGVRDNGIGLPEAVGLDNPETFGLGLVAALVDQLRGTVQIDRGAGTAFRITFPIAR